MTIRWFGKRYDAPAYEPELEIETPIGAVCCHCTEPILAGDDGWLYANSPAAHRECFIRGTIGSVAHQQKRCSCFGGPGHHDDDDNGLTYREAARRALAYWEAHNESH